MLQNRLKKECHRQVKLPRFSRNRNTLISEQPLKLYLFKIQQYIRLLTIIIEIHKIHKSKPFFPLFKSTLKLSFFTSQKNTLSTLFMPSKTTQTEKIKSRRDTRAANLPFNMHKRKSYDTSLRIRSFCYRVANSCSFQSNCQSVIFISPHKAITRKIQLLHFYILCIVIRKQKSPLFHPY